MIVVPESYYDVSLAVPYAVDMNKLVCVRDGGHHFAGLAVQDDAVMVHMRGMNQIHMSPDKKSVSIGAGATIGELDAVTQRYGLTVPTSTSSGTGVAGLALADGFGHIQYSFLARLLLNIRLPFNERPHPSDLTRHRRRGRSTLTISGTASLSIVQANGSNIT